jgi:sugar lactone lactonase YvrE
LKFSNDGSFVQQIGKAGFASGASGTELEWISDVTVDDLGQVWLVDRGANHVARFDSAGNFLGDLGEPSFAGTEAAIFSSPESIALDSAGNAYVSDSKNHRIQVFDSAGNLINTIGVSNVPGMGNEYFNFPRHINIDSSDLLYVADTNNHRVQLFDVSQPLAIVYVATMGVAAVPGNDNAHFNLPTGVAIDGSRIYVSDSLNSRIQIFDRITRAYLATLINVGSGDGQFVNPMDVGVDADGNIYVVDHDNTRVQQFAADLQFVRTYGTTGVPYLTDTTHYNRPQAVALTADGGMVLTEGWGHRVIRLDASGNLVWQLGQAGIWGFDNGHFNRPSDVAISALGDIFVVDRNNHRVQVFDSAGTHIATLGGIPGLGNDQFYFPRGLAFDAYGNIYVADTGNHRVQIFNSALNYLTTLGQPGVPGSADNQFNEPFDVSVDAAGNIYVADHTNHRLQVFDNTYALKLTIGVPGVPGTDFAHLDDPTAVELDMQGRIYVADNWGGRIQVFDAAGAYLTTLGGSWGSRSGDLRQAQGLALGSDGSLYIADSLNHRIQRFTPGVFCWSQNNINGFGDPLNWWIAAMTEFNGNLFAGVHNLSGNGAQLWMSAPGQNWTQLVADGFEDDRNYGISSMAVFQGQIFAGTENMSGTQVLKSSDGSNWVPAAEQGFGSPASNLRVTAMNVYDGSLYAAAGNWISLNSDGAQVWRTSDGFTWTNVITQGFDTKNNSVVLALESIGGYFYAGTRNEFTGGELWRSDSGDPGTWVQVNINGFGDSSNTAISSLVAFNGMIYASTRNWDNGAEVWQSSDGLVWTQVASGGFGDGGASGWADSLTVYGGSLVVVLRNYNDGVKVLSTHDGLTWKQLNPDGWGDNNNPHTGDGDASVIIYNNQLMIGTGNVASGAEIWTFLGTQAYLPSVYK